MAVAGEAGDATVRFPCKIRGLAPKRLTPGCMHVFPHVLLPPDGILECRGIGHINSHEDRICQFALVRALDLAPSVCVLP